ncbi:MAG: hypothetical protein JWO80_360, partial [Bryobacterales bacterium]|nr:hypothetical protein [Bryobacterales bacterium]
VTAADFPIVISSGGVSSQANLFITLQQ